MGQVGTLRRLSAGAVTITAVTLLALFASTLAGAAKVEPVQSSTARPMRARTAPTTSASWSDLDAAEGRHRSAHDGVYSDGTLTVTISNAQNDTTFDWSSNIGVDAVVVKGGSDGADLYRYDPPSETTSDTGLTTPGRERDQPCQLLLRRRAAAREGHDHRREAAGPGRVPASARRVPVQRSHSGGAR